VTFALRPDQPNLSRSTAEPTSPLLLARISVDYRNKTGVLKDVSFAIDPGEIVGLVGQSGSGKSTLALALLNLLPHKGGVVRGEVLFHRENLLQSSEKRLRELRGKDISIVLQSPLTALNPVLSIGAQLTECWKVHTRGTSSERQAAIGSALENVTLPTTPDFLRRLPSQLSLGQGQRVCIAMAILHRPALLIADEATSALDAITQSEILALFARLNRVLGMAVLYISHDLLSVATLCHRVCILHDSQIVESGAPQQIFYSPQHPYTRQLIAALPAIPPPADSGSPADDLLLTR
jgi:ABC-type dipeptide/oligopeptide/nickel transport system ATPase component